MRRNFEVILQDHVAKMACYIRMTDGEVELTLAPVPLALACFLKAVSFIEGSIGRARMVRLLTTEPECTEVACGSISSSLDPEDHL